jgi:hypothetical protein
VLLQVNTDEYGFKLKTHMPWSSLTHISSSLSDHTSVGSSSIRTASTSQWITGTTSSISSKSIRWKSSKGTRSQSSKRPTLKLPHSKMVPIQELCISIKYLYYTYVLRLLCIPLIFKGKKHVGIYLQTKNKCRILMLFSIPGFNARSLGAFGFAVTNLSPICWKYSII